MKEEYYKAEEYWDVVAINLKSRKQNNLLAGDDDPYYLYKRKKFLRIFHQLPIAGKKIIEIGCGPGGNLIEAIKLNPAEIVGVDISNEMVTFSQTLLNGAAEVVKIDGVMLPFETNHFDIVFTSTVLQHVSDDVILANLVREMSRVSSEHIYIFERIEKKRKAITSNIGRTKEEYITLFKANNFTLAEVKFLNLQWSWLVCGSIRRIFNPRKRKEGERETTIAKFLQQISLVVTKHLDKLFPVKRDLAMLHFKKIFDK